MIAGIRNWETTVTSATIAGLMVLKEYNDGTLSFENWRSWIIPVLIAVLGAVARDADKSSEISGLK